MKFGTSCLPLEQPFEKRRGHNSPAIMSFKQRPPLARETAFVSAASKSQQCRENLHFVKLAGGREKTHQPQEHCAFGQHFDPFWDWKAKSGFQEALWPGDVPGVRSYSRSFVLSLNRSPSRDSVFLSYFKMYIRTSSSRLLRPLLFFYQGRTASPRAPHLLFSSPRVTCPVKRDSSSFLSAAAASLSS